MDPQQKILNSIREESLGLINSKIGPLITELVDKKINQTREEWLTEMNIVGDVFPKPSRPIQKIFRLCGACPRCQATDQAIKSMATDINKTEVKIDVPENLFPDEYILICSSSKPPPTFSQQSSNNSGTWYISNYGRPFMMSDNGRGRQGGLWDATSNDNDLSPLTQEFINYYNSFKFYGGQYGAQFETESSQKMISEYQSHNPKSKDIYKLEKDKEQIQKMTSQLQRSEAGLVSEQARLKSMEYNILLREKTLKENEMELTDKINIYKKKSLNLLERENKVSIKESIRTIQQELLDISLSISEILDIRGEPILEGRLEQVMGKLNHLQGPNEELREEVIIATEVSPEASAPHLVIMPVPRPLSCRRNDAGGGDGTREVCYAHQRGECTRGDDCRFSHSGT
jgi:hypothetical protein